MVFLYRQLKSHQQDDYISTPVLLILKFLSAYFVSTYLCLQTPYLLIIMHPIVNMANYTFEPYSVPLSFVLLVFYSVSFSIFQRFFAFKYNNSKVQWSYQQNLAPNVNFLYQIIQASFALTAGMPTIADTIFTAILLIICIIKMWLKILNPFFYNTTLSFIQFNSEIMSVTLYSSALVYRLLEVGLLGFCVTFIVTAFCLIPLGNYLFIQKQQNLIQGLLRGDLKTPTLNEAAIYAFLDYVFSKSSIKTNYLNGVLMLVQENQLISNDLNDFQSYLKICSSIEQEGLLRQLEVEEDLDGGPIQQENNIIVDNIPHAESFMTQKSTIFQYTNNQSTANIHTYTFNGQPNNNDQDNQLIQNYANNQGLYEQFSQDFIDLNNQFGKRNQFEGARTQDGKIIDYKISFLVDELLTHLMQKFPNSVKLMFIKSYLSIQFQKNRFLCLTVITAIENINTSKSYLSQIENKISQQYLLDICLKEQSKTLDQANSHSFLDYNLKMNDYFQLLQNASLLVNSFWIVLDSLCSAKQVIELESSSLQISDQLRKIKLELNNLESDGFLINMSTQIYYYTAVFYQMSLRDQHQSDQYFQKITLQKQLVSIKSNLQQDQSFDETALTIVDGNFQNMGKIFYVNKILAKALKYQNSEIEGNTFHMLMPHQIAEVHDKFWDRFKQTGVPSILERYRFMFIKDKQGYVTPFKTFIKFVYHQIFGYVFLGIFRIPKTMVMQDIERPMKLSNLFFFLTNQYGKLLEISRSCEKIIGFSSNDLMRLSSFLGDGLNIYHFNPHLAIQNFDFQKSQCFSFNQVQLNIEILSKFRKELEIEIDFDNMNHRPNTKAIVNTQAKIVKETYGHNDVTIFYFMFSIISMNDHYQNGSKQTFSHAHETNLNVVQNSHAKIQGSSSKIITDDSFIGNGSHNSKQSSGTIQSEMSQLSKSSTSNNFDKLKYLDDNIDYTKTPRSLLLLKIIFNSIFFLLLSLTISLVILNSSQKSSQQQQLEILIQSYQSQLYMSQLSIYSNSFGNIWLGLEQNSTANFNNRQGVIYNSSQDILELLRNLQKTQFITSQSQTFSSKSIESLELLYNHTILSQNYTMNYALNTYIVKSLEYYDYQNLTSKIETFLSKPSDILTEQDLTKYFVIANQDGDLKTQMQTFSSLQYAKLQDQQISYIKVSLVFMIVTICTIFIGVLTALYFYSKIIEGQTKMLAFFSEIKKDLVDYCYQGSKDFYLYLMTEREGLIQEDLKRIEQRKDKKMERQKQYIIREEKKKLTTDYDTKDQLNQKSEGNLEESKAEEDQTDYQLENIKNQEEIMSVFHTRILKKHKSNNKKRNNGKGESKMKLPDQNNEGIFEQKRKELTVSTTHLMFIFRQWKLRKMGFYSGIFLSMSAVYIAYFVIQYYLIQTFLAKIANHSTHLQNMFSGQTCLNNLISQLRVIQTTNGSSEDTVYQTDEYAQCIQSNQDLYQWLSSVKDDPSISNNNLIQNGADICAEIYSEYSTINVTLCQQIYKGVLKDNLFQIISVFLHDSLQTLITFEANQNKNKTYLRQALNDIDTIDMIDAQQFYLQKALQILSTSINSALVEEEYRIGFQQLYFFGVYIFMLLTSLFVLNCFIFSQMGKSIWNSKIIFKLLPFEELDDQFKRRVQQFLF